VGIGVGGPWGASPAPILGAAQPLLAGRRAGGSGTNTAWLARRVDRGTLFAIGCSAVSAHEDPSEGARRGPFWDVLEGRREPPPAAVLLGWELVVVDPEEGTIEVAFTATEQFTNPAGHIQGGFLAAMLDDTLGPALVATLGDGE
jgi:hypothetical protein